MIKVAHYARAFDDAGYYDIADKMFRESFVNDDNFDARVLKEQKFPDELNPRAILRKEIVRIKTDPDHPVKLNSVYNPEGDYVGSKEDADFIIVKMGIMPEKRTPDSSTCSMGWSDKHNKFFGWSHRAIQGFGIGDEFFDGFKSGEGFESDHECSCGCGDSCDIS